jgi:hypothetical protein
MKTNFSFSLILFLLLGCNQKPTVSRSDHPSKECKPYFEFNKINYYHTDVVDTFIWKLTEKERSAQETKYLMFVSDILDGDQDSTGRIANEDPIQSDTADLESLAEFAFLEKEIASVDMMPMSKIFCDAGREGDIRRLACTAIYRDILVFKQGNRTVGFAKLCFDCERSVIVGSNANTFQFGQTGEFEKLRALLSSPK